MALAKASSDKPSKPVMPISILEETLATPARPAPQKPVSRIGSEREEIKQRVASFKALQERVQRDREEYCDRTLREACERLEPRNSTATRTPTV
jgi:hypothetical protein